MKIYTLGLHGAPLNCEVISYAAVIHSQNCTAFKVLPSFYVFPGLGIVLPTFLTTVKKPSKSKLRKKEFILPRVLRGYSPLWQGRHGYLTFVKKREMSVGLLPFPLCPLIWIRSPDHGIEPLVCRIGAP